MIITTTKRPNAADDVLLKAYILDTLSDVQIDLHRPAVLICPGSGYKRLSEREDEAIAMKFLSFGFNAFVLKYSVGENLKHPMPITDIMWAISHIRENNNKYKINKDKIAVCGFSAGGHCAASLGVFWNNSEYARMAGTTIMKTKPNALILCYPVITAGDYAHKGSFEYLLKDDVDNKAARDSVSLEKHVGEHTPPTYIFHTMDDQSVPVENSLLFASALAKNKIPFELHIFPTGPHGISLAENFTANRPEMIQPRVQDWICEAITWLRDLFKV